MERLLLLVPLLVINFLHLFMVVSAVKSKHSIRSISESALRKPHILRTYQAAHLIGAGCLIAYALILTSQDRFLLAAAILILGAVFDIIQSLTLSSKTSHNKFNFRDIHQFMAYVMAAFYALFTLIFLLSVGVSVFILLSVFACYVGIMTYSALQDSDAYWINQMILFSLMSFLILFGDQARIAP